MYFELLATRPKEVQLSLTLVVKIDLSIISDHAVSNVETNLNIKKP